MCNTCFNYDHLEAYGDFTFCSGEDKYASSVTKHIVLTVRKCQAFQINIASRLHAKPAYIQSSLPAVFVMKQYQIRRRLRYAARCVKEMHACLLNVKD
jgi:hypothetical protein